MAQETYALTYLWPGSLRLEALPGNADIAVSTRRDQLSDDVV